MPRYVSGNFEVEPSRWWVKGPLVPAIQTDGERGPCDTGLLDARGRKLYRLPEQVGFHTPRSRRG